MTATEGGERTSSPKLRRRLSLPMLSLYGIGVTVGAGIYVLVGKVAIGTGIHAPLSFLVAAILAGFTALSYAELGARLPQSAGEAIFVQTAFRKPALATAIGLLVMITGIVSSGAIVIGFVGYLQEVVDLPSNLVIIAVVGLLALIAAWGIGESVALAAVVTVVEVGGLLLIIGAGMIEPSVVMSTLPEILNPAGWSEWSAIISGAVLAFFAFVGFEDIVNVAEEAKDPVRTVPRAIIITLVVSSSLYFLVALVAVAVVPLDQLGESDAPLALVFETTTGRSAAVISLIAVFAVLNGVMIQLIMSSRITLRPCQRGMDTTHLRLCASGNAHAGSSNGRRRRRGHRSGSDLTDRSLGRDNQLPGSDRLLGRQSCSGANQAARSETGFWRAHDSRSLGAGDRCSCQHWHSGFRCGQRLVKFPV